MKEREISQYRDNMPCEKMDENLSNFKDTQRVLILDGGFVRHLLSRQTAF